MTQPTAAHALPLAEDILHDVGEAPVAVVRDAGRTLVATGAAEVVSASGAEALDLLDHLGDGWWAGFLAYDLGRAIEHVPDRGRASTGLPDALFVRFEERVEALPPTPDTAPPPPPPLPRWDSSLSRRAWVDAVEAVRAHLVAGHCYQVNLTRRLERAGTPDPVELFLALERSNPAPHAALLRLGDVAVVSASPECFLRREARSVTTRPIKGTASDPRALARSLKDRAENVMIVDLARNDLGRVCEYGTVEVPALAALERHPGLWHLVSTVSGQLRRGAGTGELVRATFPPASVTGCPKPRVLEIIEDLEPVRRGIYCGAVGFIDTRRDVLDLNVAIRTFTLAGGRTFLGVGAGIVALSDPEAEWEETELKASRLIAIADSLFEGR